MTGWPRWCCGALPYGEEKEEMQQDIRPTFGR
jgi:hypothetical protein